MATLTLAQLRKQSATVLRLPKAAQAVIDHYLDLHIMGSRTACPYHINCRLLSRNRALVGKGSPDEIEVTAEVYLKRFHTVIQPGDGAKLKASLRDLGIGIDCSGFVAWALNAVTVERFGKPLWKCIRFANMRRQAVGKLRPLENIAAALLTGPRNATTVTDLEQVRPGDMVRALGGGHVIVVTEVGTNAAGKALYFCYAHSTTGDEQQGGVRTGSVILTSPYKSLQDQQWSEGTLSPAPALMSVRRGGNDSRLVRLRIMSS